MKDERPKTKDQRPKTIDERPKTKDERPKTKDQRPKMKDDAWRTATMRKTRPHCVEIGPGRIIHW